MDMLRDVFDVTDTVDMVDLEIEFGHLGESVVEYVLDLESYE